MENQEIKTTEADVTLEEKQIALKLVELLYAKGNTCPVLFFDMFKEVANCIHDFGKLEYFDPYTGEGVTLKEAHEKLSRGGVLSIRKA